MALASEMLPRIYAQLRDPSQTELHYQTVLDELNNVARRRMHDLKLNPRNHATMEKRATLSYSETEDSYRISVEGTSDFEPVRLLARNGSEFIEIPSVPYETWTQATENSHKLICTFYGSQSCTDGLRVKFNAPQATINGIQFNLAHRQSFLQEIKSASKVPLPHDFYPMIEKETALNCIPKVKNDTQRWINWVQLFYGKLQLEVLNWNQAWEKFLKSSVEPNIVQLPASHFFKGANRNRRPSRPKIEY